MTLPVPSRRWYCAGGSLFMRLALRGCPADLRAVERWGIKMLVVLPTSQRTFVAYCWGYYKIQMYFLSSKKIQMYFIFIETICCFEFQAIKNPQERVRLFHDKLILLRMFFMRFPILQIFIGKGRRFDKEQRSGCCSHHGGVCGCVNGRAMCCDGVLSPSCGCD